MIRECLKKCNKVSYHRGSARRTTSVEILSTAAQMYKKTFGDACSSSINISFIMRAAFPNTLTIIVAVNLSF